MNSLSHAAGLTVVSMILASVACSSASAPSSVSGPDRDPSVAGETEFPPRAGDDASIPTRDAGPGADVDSPPPPAKYSHHLVNFDELPSGTSVTDQYKQWFTVTTVAGCELETSANYDFGQSKPNYLLTYFSCGSGATADVTFTFRKPVRKVTFKGIGINGTKDVALMKVTHADGSTSAVSLDGAGAPLTPLPVALPDTAPIAKLLFTNIDDAYGIGLDDLGFESPD